jgi:hypothetical protein
MRFSGKGIERNSAGESEIKKKRGFETGETPGSKPLLYRFCAAISKFYVIYQSDSAIG